MDQMADEMTPRAEVKDKGRASAAEESSTWARGERIQSEARGGDWRLGALQTQSLGRPGETQTPSDRETVTVDCAGIILNCLFCRLSNMVLMLPDPCERLVNQCCPNYKQVIPTIRVHS
ncbi:hypothetical protein KUCAC02_030789 [Chaenocephalus aceratus]|uniref:Uncharacterized protein n=1 Tax=Chaenocephalus aceratus TaxID=36190 RepID=A0ACB9XKK3_CHAAC|nr:hypothetical protein KUCAC02_030789 [Chaenocephalus aceratus]